MLTDFYAGQKICIDSFDEQNLAPEFINELLDFGLLPGEEITILHKSQKKILIGAGNAEIAISEKEAKHIKARKLD